MQVVNLFGKNYEFTDEAARYSSLRETYSRLADEAKEKFKKRYFSSFNGLEDLLAKWVSFTDELIDESVEVAMQNLVDLEIYELSKSDFVLKFFSKYDRRGSALEWLQDVYIDSMSGFIDEEARIAAKSTGGGVIGGGFGVEGAVTGIAVSTAANVAIGAIQGLGKTIAAAGNSYAATKKSKEIFKSAEVLEKLCECLCGSVFSVHFALLDVVDEFDVEVNPFSYPEQDVVSKSRAIFENCKSGRIAELKQKDALSVAIFMNPYDRELYFYCLQKFGDDSGELGAFYSCHKLGDFSAKKSEILISEFSDEDMSTIDRCDVLLEKVKERSIFLGCDASDLFIDIKKKRMRLDVERRTFNGVVYGSDEELDTAKSLSRRTFSGKVYTTEEEARAAQVDVERRTVRGVVYSTAKEAEVERSKKDVGFLLGLSIFITPLPNAFFTLSDGYSLTARIISMFWLVFMCWLVITPMFLNDNLSIFSKFGNAAANVFAIFVMGVISWGVRKILELLYDAIMGK